MSCPKGAGFFFVLGRDSRGCCGMGICGVVEFFHLEAVFAGERFWWDCGFFLGGKGKFGVRCLVW